MLKEVARRISGAVAGESTQKVNIPSTHHNPYLPHYIIFHFPLVFLSPQFTLAVLFALSLYLPFLSARFLFACGLVYLFVAMAQDNTKLCDFTNTINNHTIGLLLGFSLLDLVVDLLLYYPYHQY